MNKNNHHLVEVDNLKMYFPVHEGVLKRITGYIKAVDDVTFKVKEGETFGVVGESGCGKTTLGQCILQVLKTTGGRVGFRMTDDETVDLTSLTSRELRPIRKDMQLIFQDPFSSLNPRMIIRDIIGEPLVIQKIAKGKRLEEIVAGLMEKVGLRPEFMSRYPHAFSGGQRQRIGIARTLALNPRFVVCDEPVSALDMSIQAQILNLLRDIQEEFKLTYLFISHDLGVIEHICDVVAVMYAGKFVEISSTEQIFLHPGHPYTEALLSAVPKSDPDLQTQRIVLEGEVADVGNPPDGCYFHPRCRYAEDICKKEYPPLENVGGSDGSFHQIACHFKDKLRLKGVGE